MLRHLPSKHRHGAYRVLVRSGIADPRELLDAAASTIEDVVEPYLMQIGFVSRTPRGRVATDAGKNHLQPSVVARI